MDTETATDIASWTALVGFILPLLLAVINKADTTSRNKALIAFAACLIAAFGTVYFEMGGWEEITAQAYVITAAATVALARSFFSALWRPIGTTEYLERNVGVK